MNSATRPKGAAWGARLTFAALLLVASELIVWQAPLQYDLMDWLALIAVYLALAAIALDLVARLRAADAPSLLLVAGVYGLANGTLIGHVATRDLPVSLIVRPLGAQPLAFLAALGALWLLLSGRAPHLLAAAIGGVAWGGWGRWAPGASDGAIPLGSAVTALVAAALGLAACLLIAFLAPRAPVERRDDWLLGPVEWIASGAVLLAALIWGVARGDIGASVVVTLIAYMLGALIATRGLRADRCALDAVTPPRAPHVAGWVAASALFLIAGGVGYALPGSGNRSAQGDLLIGLLTAFGILWLPVVSALVGMRAFVQLAREQG